MASQREEEDGFTRVPVWEKHRAGFIKDTYELTHNRPMCAGCDAETLKMMLEPKVGARYVTAKVGIPRTCAACHSTLVERVRSLVPCLLDVQYYQVYVPMELYLKYLDGGWLREARAKFQIASTLAYVIRDLERIDKSIGPAYGDDLCSYKISLYTWAHSLLWAEASLKGMMWSGSKEGCYPCTLIASTYKGTRWRPYIIRAPINDTNDGVPPSGATRGKADDGGDGNDEDGDAPNGGPSQEVLDEYERACEMGIPAKVGTNEPLQTLTGPSLVNAEIYEIARRQLHVYEVDESVAQKAAYIGPVNDRSLYNDTLTNMIAAHNGRITVPGARDVTLTEEEIRELDIVVQAYIDKIVQPEVVTKKFVELGGVHGCKPESWPAGRWEATISGLAECERVNAYEAKIKAESGDPSKCPRLISDEKEVWQALSSPIFKVLEAIDSHEMSARNVKHKTKAELHRMMFAQCSEMRILRKKNCKCGSSLPLVFVEGDGSKWDACCGDFIHQHIEKPIVEAILNIIMESCFELPPELLGKSHKRRTKASPTVIKFCCKDYHEHGAIRGMFRVVLEQIIRSTGDSGTSYLNRVVNKLCWVHVLTRKGKQMVDNLSNPVVRYCGRYSERGEEMCCWFEGDDSALVLYGSVMDYKDKIEAHWRRLGFNMKLKFITDSKKDGTLGEFCGYHYMIEEGGLAGTETVQYATPDLKRGWRNGSRTNAREALESKEVRNAIAVDAATARAAGMAHGAGTMASEFIARAEEYAKLGTSDYKNNKEIRDFGHKAGVTEIGPEENVRASLNEALDDAICTSPYYAHDALRDLEASSLGRNRGDLAIIAGAPGLTHEDHPDTVLAFGFKYQ